MTQNRLKPVFLLIFGLLASGCDPELTLSAYGVTLVVGQKGKVRVTEGGDQAALKTATLALRDAQGQVYSPTATDTLRQLQVTALSGFELEFVVPPGIAPGLANLTVMTEGGFPFETTVQISRLAALRDLSGKVWLLGLHRAGMMQQFKEYKPADATGLGKGDGPVALSPGGELLAAGARTNKEVYLAWTGQTPMPGPLKVGEEVRSLAIASTLHTLVGTVKGTFVVAPPKNATDALSLSQTPLDTKDTVGVTTARRARKAAAIGSQSGVVPAYQITLIDLDKGQPALGSSTLLSWKVEVLNRLPLALSPDGQSLMVVNRNQSSLVFFRQGLTQKLEKTLAKGEGTPVAVVSDAKGQVFYLLNQGSKNISVARVDANGLTMASPIPLKSLTAQSGSPMDLALSENGELLVLCEKELLIVDIAAGTDTIVTFTSLFRDKQKGEQAGTLAIQP